jgi:hypothetical protein
MESMKRITLVATIALAGAFGLAGCAGQGTKQAAVADQASYEAALAEANAEVKKAKAANGAWRDMGKFLKQADEAAKAGDYAKAIKLADKVKFQAQMGQKQAAAEANVGNPAYLK